jgi:hypothetical protein
LLGAGIAIGLGLSFWFARAVPSDVPFLPPGPLEMALLAASCIVVALLPLIYAMAQGVERITRRARLQARF